MGRNAQPIDILTAKGSKHLTKAEIEGRKESEIKIGENKLRCPDYVRKDLFAYKKWKEIIKIYKGTTVVSSGDSGMLARYCMTWSAYLRLCDTRNKIAACEIDWSQYENMFPDDFQEGIEKLLSSNVDLQLENAINKKTDILLKMEDRSFLNPLAKIKNVPMKKKTVSNPLEAKGYGNV